MVLQSLNSTQIFLSQLFNDLFKNNANRSEMAEKRHNQNYFMEMITVEGVYDYLMYVGKFSPPRSGDRCFRMIRHLCSCTDGESFFLSPLSCAPLSIFPSSWGRVVFHIPDWLHHLLMTGRILFKNTLEAYTDYYLQYKLNQVVQEHRLVSLITLLRGAHAEMFRNKDSVVCRKKGENMPLQKCTSSFPPPPDAVFCESSPSRSSHDRQRRAKKTFEEMMSYIPGIPLTFFSSIM